MLLALAAGLFAGYWYAGTQKQESVATSPQTKSIKATNSAPVFYRNPMNPAITSPVPAKDEMGMDYIPVYADDATKSKEPSGTVQIDPVIEQNIGVRTVVAEKQILHQQVRAVGRVDYDEEGLYRIHPKVEGWVEKLYVTTTGQGVKKDAILLSIYSPQLVATQQEYLLALNNLQVLGGSPIKEIREGAEQLVESSRKRLQFLDVPANQVQELTTTRMVKKTLHILSPYKGIVLDIGVREGDYVTPKTQMYSLADLDKVWVYADVYEFELPWIKTNDPVEMTFAGVPGKLFKGKIAEIYPYMEEKTRTIKVRIELDNSEGLLKPDMYTNVTIKAGNTIEAVVVPAEAIVRSGKRNQVFIRRDKGKFEPREVKIGITSAGMTQILEGVQPGEEVVTSSQFLIDSESKLREATAKMMEALSANPTAQQKEPGTPKDMDMSDLDMDDLNEKELDMSDMTLENLK